MIKKSFFGLLKPRLEYDIIDAKSPKPREIDISKTVQLLCNAVFDKKDQVLLQIGDMVGAGQKLTVFKDRDDYVISPVSGTIAGIAPYVGNFGAQMTAVVINRDDQTETDAPDREFPEQPVREDIKNMFMHVPGGLPAALPAASEDQTRMLLIYGMDADLLVQTRQQIVQASAALIKEGIKVLKNIENFKSIVIVVPETLSQEAMSTGATVKTVPACYPAASPRLVLKDLLGRELPAGDRLEDQGIVVISAEAVAAIGKAAQTKTVPTRKVITVVDKIGTRKLVSAQIGTPLKDIFTALNIHPDDSDRIIIGGPMTGIAAYTIDHPVCPDTDAVMVQDRSDIPLVSDNACINCGECIRICPAAIPVNMLVRFLEVGQYDEAADNYDLYSCIECGLCSYACTAKIPIFQYIRLAKYELARIQSAEAENV